MPNKRESILFTLLCLGAVLIFRQCDKMKIEDITNEQLKPGESTAIIIGPNTGEVKVVTEPSGNGNGVRPPLLRRWFSKPPTVPGQLVQPIDGARGVRIGITPSGKVTVTARTKGFIFEPGPAIILSDRPRIGLDVQWAFLRRWGVNTGAVIGTDKSLRLYAAGSYYLPFEHFSNTSLLMGIDSEKKLLMGIKVRF